MKKSYEQLWEELNEYITEMEQDSEDAITTDTKQSEYHEGQFEAYGHITAYMNRMLEERE
ncbi:hypothetical protein [Paenibacillus flagellatus]|uniref:Uncharacterized protein n=1 Tax=Paenibacillus flagellatus TaxID=2211139 RepID=A0A2V5KNN7_9BACL|nr:hypothetical protein [Paenibacillus flagellatus]PYI49996.1 hypothetical protein DLM86_31305 [Paenibacillus flagellatus]